MAYRPASPSVALSAYPYKGSIFHIDGDGSAWDLIAFAGKKKEVFSINNGDRGYQVFADVETGAQSARSWTQASGWTAVTAFGGGGGGIGTYDYLGVIVSDDPTTLALTQGQCCIWTPTGAPSNTRFLVFSVLDKAGATQAGELDEIYSAFWSLRGTEGEFFVFAPPEDLGNGNWRTGHYLGNILTLSSPGEVVLEITPAQSLDDYVAKNSASAQIVNSTLDLLNLRNMASSTSAIWYAKKAGANDLTRGGIRFSWGGGYTGEAAMTEIFSGNQDATTAGAYLRVRSSGVEVKNGPLVLEQLPSGTPTQLVGWDSAGKLVQAGSAPAGGFVALSGHNDLGTTPWSIADDTAFANSDAGIQFDPMGAYQAHLKGNLLIDQGVSNVLTLYRQAFAIGTTQDLIFGAQNDLGNATPYVHQHSYITANTSGSEEAEWRLQTRVAGAMVERIRANATGGILSGDWSTTLNHKAKYFSSWATSGNGDWAIRDATDALNRFVIGKEPTTDNLEMYRYSDAGAYAGRVWNIDRQTGAVTYYSKGIFPASVATAASISLPTGVAVTSPVTGDMWSAAADQMQWRSGANTRRFGFLEVAQSWSEVQTYTATPVISSTTASTTAGALYKRTNFGHVGYEAGMAQEFLANTYTGPVTGAVTNSATENDCNGGTAIFATRTQSASIFQIGTYINVKARFSYTNTAANTLTIRLRYGSVSGTILGTVVLTRVNSGAESFDVSFRGVATAAPSASSNTSWVAGVSGNSLIEANATASGTPLVALATNAANALVMTLQWSTALPTSTAQTLTTSIVLD